MRKTIKNNSKSKEFEKARDKYFHAVKGVSDECECENTLCSGEKCVKNCDRHVGSGIDSGIDSFKMFKNANDGILDEGERVARETVSRSDEGDEKDGNAVVDNLAWKEAAKEFNDSLLDELQDRLERQARVYDRVVENLLDELDCLRGRIKELEDSLLEKDEFLDDVIEELADKERQLSAVRGVIDFDINIKRGEL